MIATRLTPGPNLKAPLQLLKERHLALWRGVVVFSQGDADRQRVVVAHPEVLVLKIPETADQEHRPGQ